MAISHNPKVITDNLVLYLDAGDKNSYPGSGTTWYDLCGNNDTTINGATYNSGGYFVLDGTNDYFEVTSDGSSDFAKQTFSIEFWCYIDPDEYDVLWSYDYTVHNSPYYAQHWRTGITYGTNSLYGGMNNGGAWNATTTVHDNDGTGNTAYTANKWTQLVWTVDDGGTTKISTFYQDGSSIDTETNTDWSDINYYAQEVWIGRANFSTGYYQGNIASVKFYDRTLSSQEVTQNFNAQRKRYGI